MGAVFDLAQNIFYGLVTLGILVLVHELGHFILGKATGIRVVAFSIGFGRGIVSFERGGTLYKIGWLPVGGYCRFAGEGEDLSDDRQGAPDEFYERPAWARLLTVSAGVFFNFVFAWMIFFLLSFTGYSYSSPDNRVTVLSPAVTGETNTAYPAFSAGMRTGDRVLSVNGVQVRSFQEIVQQVAPRSGQQLTLRVERNGKVLEKKMQSGLRSTGAGFINVVPLYPAVVGSVQSNSAAAAAGLRPGDRILALNSQPVASLHALIAALQRYPGRPVRVQIERQGKQMELRAVPEKSKGSVRLGFSAAEPEMKSFRVAGLGFFGSVGNAFSLFGENLKRLVEGIGLLFNKKVETRKALAGPVKIVMLSGTVMKESAFSSYLLFLGMLSIALGFFNILPIPAADGGHIMLTLIEMIRRRRFSFKVLQRIQLTGIVLLMTLFALVLFLDISSFFG